MNQTFITILISLGILPNLFITLTKLTAPSNYLIIGAYLIKISSLAYLILTSIYFLKLFNLI